MTNLPVAKLAGAAACGSKAELGRRATGPHSFTSGDFIVANARRGDERRKHKEKKSEQSYAQDL